MIDELGIDEVPAEKPPYIEEVMATFNPFGEPIQPSEVAERLGKNLYAQLSDGSDDSVWGAIYRAIIYVGTVLRRLNVAFDFDNRIVREVILMHTIYELHLSLGHEEAGKEYRMKARDTIRAAWGDFPEADSAPEKSAAAAVAVPKKKERKF